MTNQNDGASTGGEPVTGAPPIIKAEPENPVPSKPATEADLKEVERQMSGFERSTLRWTRASFIIVLATAIFIGLQWLEMRSGGSDTHDLAVAAKTQAEKMKDMSDAAEKIRQAAEGMVTQEQRIADNAERALTASTRQSKAALDISIKSARQQERAWIGLISINATGTVITNYGRSPAINISNKGAATFVDTEVQITDKWVAAFARDNKMETLNVGAIFPGQTFGQPIPDVTKSSWMAEVKQRKKFLYQFGYISYFDIFGAHHITRICGVWSPELVRPWVRVQ